MRNQMSIEPGTFPTRGNFEFSPHHLWVSREDDVATIGLTDYAQRALGSIDSLELPDIGQVLRQGDSFGIADGEIAIIKLYIPISGVIVEVHESLRRGGASVNTRPYGMGMTGGWLIKVRMTDPSQSLMSMDEYIQFIERTARIWI